MPDQQAMPRWLDDEGCVAVDWPCLHCGYNLRTRHETDGCPACGTRVSNSGPRPGEFKLINVEWAPPPEPRRRFWLIFAAVIVGTPVVLAAILILVPLALQAGPTEWAIVIALGVAMIGLIIWRRRRAIVRATNKLREALAISGDDPAKAIEAALATARPPYFVTLSNLGGYLVGTGHVGVCVRIARQESLTDLKTIAVPFEAIPFDEFDERFDQVTAAGRPPRAEQLLEKLLTRDERPESKRTYRWWIARRRWVAVLFGVTGIVAVTRMAWDQRVSFWSAYFVLIAIWIGFAFLRDASIRGQRLFFIPGGVMRRWPRKGKCEVDVFSRRNSVLALLQTDRDSFAWTVVDQSGRWCGYMATKTEAEMLVRTWLSPIEPPTPDRLSDFA